MNPLFRNPTADRFQVLLHHILRRPFRMADQLPQHLLRHDLSVCLRDGIQIRYHIFHCIDREGARVEHTDSALRQRLVTVPQLHPRMRQKISLADVLKKAAEIAHMIPVSAKNNRSRRRIPERLFIMERMIHQNVYVRDAVRLPEIPAVGPIQVVTKVIKRNTGCHGGKRPGTACSPRCDRPVQKFQQALLTLLFTARVIDKRGIPQRLKRPFQFFRKQIQGVIYPCDINNRSDLTYFHKFHSSVSKACSHTFIIRDITAVRVNQHYFIMIFLTPARNQKPAPQLPGRQPVCN